MIVSTVNRHKNMPVCFYVAQCKMKRLNNTLSFTLTSSLTSKQNMKKFSFLPKSSPVQACRQTTSSKIFQNFQALSESKRYEFRINAFEKSGWGMLNFQDLPKKRNPRSTHHKFSFPCSENVKLSHERQSFLSV